MSLIKNFFRKLSRKLEVPFLSYGILKKCTRCVYGKSHEPILIFSRDRGPRIIIFPNSKCYLRHGECLGFKECGKCFEAIGDPGFKCEWKEF